MACVDLGRRGGFLSALAVAATLAIASCGGDGTVSTGDSNGTPGGGTKTGKVGDPGGGGTTTGGGSGGGADSGTPVVYAHSAGELYKVDPDTLKISLIGSFGCGSVTDIAIDKAGVIVGLTFTELVSIDSATAHCRVVAQLPSGAGFNGLSWVRDEKNGGEILVGTALDGSVWKIDPVTGTPTQLGSMGQDLRSSGDLVSVAKLGTVATTLGNTTGLDSLVHLDPATGAATVIGSTGYRYVWGVGFWKDKVFGFTEQGEFILIDPKTGAGTLVEKTNVSWWGAGVTTSALVTLIE